MFARYRHPTTRSSKVGGETEDNEKKSRLRFTLNFHKLCFRSHTFFALQKKIMFFNFMHNSASDGSQSDDQSVDEQQLQHRDDNAPLYSLKVFVGGLPKGTTEGKFTVFIYIFFNIFLLIFLLFTIFFLNLLFFSSSSS